MRTPLEKGATTMKATGIVRRIDDLGRVVVPKEIRRTLRIREGDPLLTTLSDIVDTYGKRTDSVLFGQNVCIMCV